MPFAALACAAPQEDALHTCSSEDGRIHARVQGGHIAGAKLLRGMFVPFEYIEVVERAVRPAFTPSVKVFVGYCVRSRTWVTT